MLSSYRRQNNRHVDCGTLNERRSNGKRALRACTEAVFYWEPMAVYQKRCDMTTLVFFSCFFSLFFLLFLSRAALFWIFCMHAKVALQQSSLDVIMDATTSLWNC